MTGPVVGHSSHLCDVSRSREWKPSMPPGNFNVFVLKLQQIKIDKVILITGMLSSLRWSFSGAERTLFGSAAGDRWICMFFWKSASSIWMLLVCFIKDRRANVPVEKRCLGGSEDSELSQEIWVYPEIMISWMWKLCELAIIHKS